MLIIMRKIIIRSNENQKKNNLDNFFALLPLIKINDATPNVRSSVKALEISF
jgi:hypothetical protein